MNSVQCIAFSKEHFSVTLEKHHFSGSQIEFQPAIFHQFQNVCFKSRKLENSLIN